MLTALRILLGLLGASAMLIAASIIVFGAQATAAGGEAAYAALTGSHGPVGEPWSATVDSELRFYAALWAAFGALALWTAQRLPARVKQALALAGVFFLGGLGRLASLMAVGAPHPFFVTLMAIELALPLALVALALAAGRAAVAR